MKEAKRFYYGFEYMDGENTTCGTPNDGFELWNGRMSIAGKEIAFTSKKERDAWVDQGCSSYGGRIACNLATIKDLNAGSTNEARAMIIWDLQDQALNR